MDNIEDKFLKLCDMQQGYSPLRTGKFKKISFNIVGSEAQETSSSFLEPQGQNIFPFLKLQINTTHKACIVLKDIWYQNYRWNTSF